MQHSPAVVPTALALVWALIALVLGSYVAAARRHPRWSPWRTLSFVGGGALLLVALSSSVVHWAHADLRGHMFQHLLLGMFAPLLFVMAAPVTLFLASVGPRTARRTVRVLHSRPVRVLSHPIAALLLNVGGMVLLYSTQLFVLSRSSAWLHVLVHYHFLAAGYLFAWSIAGPDPAPGRPSVRYRAVVLFVAIAVHSTLGKLMYVHGWPQGAGVARSELEAAAQWMYYGGDLAEMLLIAALGAVWYAERGRSLASARTEATSH
ncbi:cytochrome c oxidase assembly protein [Cognatilysobacter bugurensis]|uniref:Membrane protein n=1 Tax=Cognatilysobacter bugurensis TaxID=543356 RepID=A0A918STZ2_9GAMM|nr:cytochrome c oxidase assembly protein [Lysobacter bugurensis]GHA70216.1 membrane protein [Lysobacter bugurensis]